MRSGAGARARRGRRRQRACVVATPGNGDDAATAGLSAAYGCTLGRACVARMGPRQSLRQLPGDVVLGPTAQGEVADESAMAPGGGDVQLGVRRKGESVEVGHGDDGIVGGGEDGRRHAQPRQGSASERLRAERAPVSRLPLDPLPRQSGARMDNAAMCIFPYSGYDTFTTSAFFHTGPQQGRAVSRIKRNTLRMNGDLLVHPLSWGHPTQGLPRSPIHELPMPSPPRRVA